MTDFSADELHDFTRLQRMREGGYFESEGSVPMPEIVADGEGPDEGWLPEQTSAHGTPTAQYTTRILCPQCENQTDHFSYGCGFPTRHCQTCCRCGWCGQRRDFPRPMGVTQYYCQDCGQKEDATGRCSNCWGGA